MLESFNTDKFDYKRLSLEEQEKRGILGRLVGKIADTKNATRNGRKYSNALWENVFNDPIMQEKIDNHLLLGNLGHPAEDEEISMEKAAICMAERPKKGKDGFLYGVFDILSTPAGKILKSLCDYGCNVAISSRGSGDIVYDNEGNEEVDPDTYVCETFDVVVVPGVEQARLQYVTEALDTKKRNKTLRQKLVEDLDNATEEDKMIMQDTLKNLDINLEEESSDYIGKEETTGSSMYQTEDGKFIATYQGTSLSADSLEELKQLLVDAYEEKKNEINDLPEDLNEKLVEPTEEDLAPIEAKFAELGLEIEGKGKTLFDNVHYQLRKELDHKVTKEDLGPIFDALCDLDREDMPTVCNVGIHRDGDNIISASLDVLQKQVNDTNEEFYVSGDKLDDAKLKLKMKVDSAHLRDDLLDKADYITIEELIRKYLSKEDRADLGNETNEELQDNDGWGEEIADELEPIFDDLDRVMYEVRNAVRGSYGIRGKNVEDLVAKLNDLSDQLAMKAEEFEEDEDRLNEGMPLDHKAQRELIGKLTRINELSGEILAYDQEYDFNDEEDQLAIDHINDTLDKLKDLAAKLNIPTNEGCDDKEVKEDAGNAGLVDQLQEALTKSAKLEKDNLSLQEKLSVCNAKEVKMEESLAKYKKAVANLSESTKKVNSLEEELDSVKKDLKGKDKLLESKNRVINNYKSRLSLTSKTNKDKLDESVNKTTNLENKVKDLTEQLEEKSKKLDKITSIAKKYQSALKESKDSYIRAKAEACGIDYTELKAQLKESYTIKDIDSICDNLLEQKLSLSKLPFRLNESTKLSIKSSQESIKPGRTLGGDDEISDTLLSFIN